MTSLRPIQALAEPPRNWLPAGAVGARGRPHCRQASSLRSGVLRLGAEARPRPPPTASQAWAWHASSAGPTCASAPSAAAFPGSGTGARLGGELSSARVGRAA
ncbi:unnamed protein product [Rangifer tarandus platyrhynchus]|uniref:Uncharacterized protein n=2 Tax=Rangifer tarandus platyrhynchus TaxID=3082113 RepID=A0ABN8YRA1_RANTA|nr:unnamed protein product [Rangifer tarandus platyrhynchus]CAI9701056.1 unnamed protein product [Rangifer tarandus platyrhynchus]